MNIDWKETLKSIAAVAPTVATALGGPLAGLAVNVATSALGIDPSKEAIAEAVATGNPDVFLKLKEAETNLTIKLKELDVQLQEIDVQDRDSARKREMEIKDSTPKILGGIIIFGFFAVIAFLLINGISGIPPEVIGLMGILIGQVSSKAEQVTNYFFGSSAGSRRKSEQLTEIVTKKPGF